MIGPVGSPTGHVGDTFGPAVAVRLLVRRRRRLPTGPPGSQGLSCATQGPISGDGSRPDGEPMRTIRSAGFTAVLIVTLAAAGCGGGGGAPAPASGAATGPAAASAAPSAAASMGAGNGGATGGPVAAGGDLCGLLGPGDFAAAGVAGAGALTSNSTPPTDYYCVYAGTSSGTGGIEFDAFLLASADDPDGVFDTVLNESGILDPDRTRRGRRRRSCGDRNEPHERHRQGRDHRRSQGAARLRHRLPGWA